MHLRPKRLIKQVLREAPSRFGWIPINNTPLLGLNHLPLHKRLHGRFLFMTQQVKSSLPQMILGDAALSMTEESLVQKLPVHCVKSPAFPCAVAQEEAARFPALAHIPRQWCWKRGGFCRGGFCLFHCRKPGLQAYGVCVYPVVHA